MNDIEIIDYLKEIIQEIEYRHKDGELILVNDITTDKLYYSIKGLLDLYNKEKERNKDLEQIEKEHKEENGRLREENKNLEKELEEKDMQHELELIGKEEFTKANMAEIIEHYYTANEDCIPKSKIKEKIEKLLQEGTFKYKRMRKLENTIGMSPDEYAELNKLWVEVDTIETKISTFKELLEESDK